MSERKQKDWRELCAAVSNERDSTKLSLLIQELIEALDERWGKPSVYAVPRSSHRTAEDAPC
jgi:hypothetical protein